MSYKDKLNLPELNIHCRTAAGREEVWDAIRKRWLVLTPEEWVRQSFIGFLCTYRGADPMLVRQELPLSLHETARRADIVVFSREGLPRMVVECKEPRVKITHEVLEQVAGYNAVLQVPWVVVTNGLSHYCFQFDPENKIYRKTDNIPNLGG